MMEYAPILTVILGMAIAFGIQRVMKRKREAQRPADPKPVREQWEERNQQMDAQRSADAILVELVETSREISARMDSKIRILNTLIRNAERCIERMEELNGGVTQGPESRPDFDSVPAPASSVRASSPSAEETPAFVRSPVGSLRSAEVPGADSLGVEAAEPALTETVESAPDTEVNEDVMQLSAASSGVAESPAAGSAPLYVPSENHRRILDLQTQGYSVPEIARDVGLSRQEVNIVLHLNRHSRA